MYPATDDLDHRETEIAHEAFELAGADDRHVDEEFDAGPWRHPRVSEVVDLDAGRQRFSILCDDGQDREIKALVAKLNKKLGKWGQTITIVADETKVKDHWFKKTWDGKPVQITQVLLTIEAPTVSGKKAKLIGSFEGAEDGVSVYRHALNGATEADLEPFLPRWQECDHCGLKRHRQSSFLCETLDGARVVIGRQCSRDYLGLEASELLAREAVRKALAAGGDEEYDEDRPRGGGSYIHVETVVRAAFRVAKRYGGYSKDTSERFRLETDSLLGMRGKEHDQNRAAYKEFEAKHPPGDLDLEDFARYVKSATGDFGENLNTALACEYAKAKRKNLIVAGAGLYVGRTLKRAAEKAEQADQPPAKHLEGVEKQRVDFTGTVERCFTKDGIYGITTIISILADDGSRCVHYSTGEAKPEAGKHYAIRGTIKRQGKNNRTGEPETVLARATYTAADASQPKLL
jgi:hypothetical protein